MNRRVFLETIAPLALATRQSRPNVNADVVVVGAGLAGLRAAALLQKAGRSVIVLEARDRPGGRVHTIRRPFDEDLYGEAGPIRIPDLHQTVLNLARAHGLNLVPFESPSGSPVININGITARVPEDLAKVTSKLVLKPDETALAPSALLQRYISGLPDDLRNVSPSATDYERWRPYDAVTWPAWLQSRGAFPGAVTLMTLGGDSRELSALYVLRQIAMLQKTTQFYKIQGGMDRLPAAMAGALGKVIRFNCAVTSIDHTGTSIRIDYVENGRTRTVGATRVILALPFSTLRDIGIRPRFSERKQKTIQELPYFPATRVLLQARSSFWQKADLNGSARTDQPAEIWDCTYDLAGTRGILGATVGGALGRTLTGMTEQAALNAGTDVVARTFPEIRREFEKGVVYRWSRDRWARGAFTVFRPGQMTNMMSQISRPEGRIHFAGEHTSSWMGWMEGALQSGERAANEVLASR